MNKLKAKVIPLPNGDWYMDKLYENAVLAKFTTNSGVGPYGGWTTEKINTSFPVEYQDHHLYFITDEEIKDNDWCHDIINNHVFKCDWVQEANDKFPKTLVSEDNQMGYDLDHCEKVVVTTDPRLSLPQPSKEFIEEYCKKNGNIDEVYVEMEQFTKEVYSPYFEEPGTKVTNKIKVNSDNTINILPIKTSWTKHEVIELCKSAYYHGTQNYNSDPDLPDDWIDKNL